jgi:sec-independent protein translocase protein TatA
MVGFGPTELILILVIVLVLFGVGRLARLGGELGSGIRQLKNELQDDSPPEDPAARKE